MGGEDDIKGILGVCAQVCFVGTVIAAARECRRALVAPNVHALRRREDDALRALQRHWQAAKAGGSR